MCYTVIRCIHACSENENHEYKQEDPVSSEKINPGKVFVESHPAESITDLSSEQI
jgi:hypothetical protein